MKKTLNIKKLKKKNSMGKKTQRSNGEDSVILSGNEKENAFNDEDDRLDNINNNNEEMEEDEEDPLILIPKQKKQKEKQPPKREMTTLELQDLKIQQDLLDIADSARSRDSFGPWLPPPKQSIKVRSQSKHEGRHSNAKSSISQKNILLRPQSTHMQYTEDNFQYVNNSHNLIMLNPISQNDLQNAERNTSGLPHSLTQENFQSGQPNNTLLGHMGNDIRRQIASVKNIHFDDLEIANIHNNRIGHVNTEHDFQEGSVSYNNKVLRTSPQRKATGVNPRMILEKRIQGQQCECNRVNTQQSQQQQQQQGQYSKQNKKYTLNDQQDSIMGIPLLTQQVNSNFQNLMIRPPESQKNCYNMPMRNTLPRFLKKTAIKIKSDYNQYIKGHSHNNIYSTNVTANSNTNNGKSNEDQQKKNQEIYYQEISELLNKTINTFNFNNVIDTNEAEHNMRLTSQNSQISRYSPIIKSKKSQSPTKRFSLEQTQLQNAPQVKISNKSQYRMSHQGIPIDRDNKVKTTTDELRTQSDLGEDEDQLQNLQLERAESSSPSYRQVKKGNKNAGNINRILLEIQQTAATDEPNQGEISNRNLNLNLQKQKLNNEKEKVPLALKQVGGTLLTVNPHAILPFPNNNNNTNGINNNISNQANEMQRINLISNNQKESYDKKGMIGQKLSQSRPISQQKRKPSRDALSGDGKSQISIQFKLSYHRGKSLINQHQNERQNITQNGIYQNNPLQIQNSFAFEKNNNNNNNTNNNNNNPSAVQRKISQVISQFNNNNNSGENVNQSGFSMGVNKGKPSQFLKNTNTQHSDEFDYEDDIKQMQTTNFGEIKNKNNQDQSRLNKNEDALHLQTLKKRRVLSAQSNHQEEKKRLSLQSNTLLENNNGAQINQRNSSINNENIENNIINQQNNTINTFDNILVPRNIKSPFMNYRRQLSNGPTNSNNNKAGSQQMINGSKIKKNLSFDNDIIYKANEQTLEKDNAQNFMHNVDASLLFNQNALEFNGRASLQSQEYHKKRQSYLKPQSVNLVNHQKAAIPKSTFNNKPKQISIEQKVTDLTSFIPYIDCKKII